MARELFVPKLGQTVEEVTLVKWLAEDGAQVVSGQEILEVETDKAVFPIEANAKGVLHRGPFQEGQVLPVLAVVAVIGQPDDRFPQAGPGPEGAPPAGLGSVPAAKGVAGSANQPLSSPPGAVVWDQGKLFASPRARRLAKKAEVDLSDVHPTGGGGVRIVEKDVQGFLDQQPAGRAPARISPLAQRMAAVEGVDIGQLLGSGPGGKIVKEDVARALSPEAGTPAAGTGPAIGASAVSAAGREQPEVVEQIPLKGVRGLIAERMGNSVRTTARVTLVMEVDATELVSARSRIKARVEKDWGFAPGYNDLLAMVVAQGLRRHPYMNARLNGAVIEVLGHINLGMAVDTERGLLVLVIKNAGQKGLRQFGAEFRALVERARLGKALPDEMTGGTFTLTNLGMYEVDAFTPVINLPEAAILGVGRIAPKPVVVDGSVAIRQMMTLSLAFDHRLVDGAPAARFLQFLKELIEEPYLMLAG